MPRAESSRPVVTFDEIVGDLKHRLRFSEWPLKERELVAGLSPEDLRPAVLADYRLERETLLPPVISRVTRRYSYRKIDSYLALTLTVIVSEFSRETAEGLVLLIAASQMRIEPLVEFEGVGDVTVYRQPDSNQSIAFLRNNVGINIEWQARPEDQLPIRELAQQIDAQLLQAPKRESLTDNNRAPKIVRFEPKTTTVKTGGRTDLTIVIEDNDPPHDLLFDAIKGSYNRDPSNSDLWYFRAGHVKGSAEVTLTVVNRVNLMARARTPILID